MKVFVLFNIDYCTGERIVNFIGVYRKMNALVDAFRENRGALFSVQLVDESNEQLVEKEDFYYLYREFDI